VVYEGRIQIETQQNGVRFQPPENLLRNRAGADPELDNHLGGAKVDGP
jgi:hypothetical protein